MVQIIFFKHYVIFFTFLGLENAIALRNDIIKRASTFKIAQQEITLLSAIILTLDIKFYKTDAFEKDEKKWEIALTSDRKLLKNNEKNRRQCGRESYVCEVQI